jgi:hypothetical protein
LDALTGNSFLASTSPRRGHGRFERRTIQIINAPAHIRMRFPHARQVALIERVRDPQAQDKPIRL